MTMSDGTPFVVSSVSPDQAESTGASTQTVPGRVIITGESFFGFHFPSTSNSFNSFWYTEESLDQLTLRLYMNFYICSIILL